MLIEDAKLAAVSSALLSLKQWIQFWKDCHPFAVEEVAMLVLLLLQLDKVPVLLLLLEGRCFVGKFAQQRDRCSFGYFELCEYCSSYFQLMLDKDPVSLSFVKSRLEVSLRDKAIL